MLAPGSRPESLDVFLSKYLEKFSKRLDGWIRLRGSYGVRKLRKTLQISQRCFAELLEPFTDSQTGRVYSTCTISMWEWPERRKKLPKNYWRNHFPRHGRTIKQGRVTRVGAWDAIASLIKALVEWSSRGNYTAHVTGTRKWQVTLKRLA